MPETYNGGGSGGGRMAPPILLKPSADATAADALAAEIMGATGAWDRGAPPPREARSPAHAMGPARTTNDPEAFAAEIIAAMDGVEPCGR